MTEAVNHPAHYNAGGIEVIDAIEAWDLGFALGNCVKYIARAKHKGTELQDLEKAAWYLAREIANLEKGSQPDAVQRPNLGRASQRRGAKQPGARRVRPRSTRPRK